MNITQALDDANVFGGQFRGGTWDAWRTFLAALFALPLTPEQLEVYQRHTGRSVPPIEPAQEAWLVCGRRAGKSLILATIAVFLAAFCDWRPFLGPDVVEMETQKTVQQILHVILIVNLERVPSFSPVPKLLGDKVESLQDLCDNVDHIPQGRSRGDPDPGHLNLQLPKEAFC